MRHNELSNEKAIQSWILVSLWCVWDTQRKAYFFYFLNAPQYVSECVVECVSVFAFIFADVILMIFQLISGALDTRRRRKRIFEHAKNRRQRWRKQRNYFTFLSQSLSLLVLLFLTFKIKFQLDRRVRLNKTSLHITRSFGKRLFN